MREDDRRTLFEKSVPGRRCGTLPRLDIEEKPLDTLIPPAHLRKTPAELPEVGEHDLVRHFSNLAKLNSILETP